MRTVHTYCDTPSIHTHTHTHARTHTQTCMHTAHMRTHTRTHTCTCAHTHTHTHKKKKKTTTMTPIHVTTPNTTAIRPAPSVFTRSMNIRPPEQQNPKNSPPNSSRHPATNSIPSHAAWKILPSPVNTKHAYKNPETTNKPMEQTDGNITATTLRVRITLLWQLFSIQL